jgi:peptide/nickel transport system substrate-binding protein
VPKAYVEKVGDDGFMKAPIGAGPYKFVSYKPGIELVLEAFEPYWRKTPAVKELAMRAIPDEATRLAALKRGEVDIIYWITGELAEEVQRTPGLTLKRVHTAPFWLYFPDQWDPKSPWHDERVRRAASLAIDRQIIKRGTDPRPVQADRRHHPGLFRVLLAAAGPALRPGRGLAAARRSGPSDGSRCRRLLLRCRLCQSRRSGAQQPRSGRHPGEAPPDRARSLFQKLLRQDLQGPRPGGSAAFGNAATRLEAFVVKGGAYAYGSYPDIDELFRRQAAELDHQRRQGLLTQMQQLVHERTTYAPIWQLGAMFGVGPRVGESTFGLIAGYPWTSPYEDITLKAT